MSELSGQTSPKSITFKVSVSLSTPWGGVFVPFLRVKSRCVAQGLAQRRAQ